MIVWWRIFCVIVGSFFRPRLRTAQELIHDGGSLCFRVGPTEAEGRLLNNARYFTFMEAGRTDLMFRTGLIKLVLKNKWQPVVSSQWLKYLRPLMRWQKFRLTTRLVGWDEKKLYIEHRFWRNDQMHALGLVQIVVRDRHQVVPVAEIFAKMAYDLPALKMPEAVKKWLEFEAAVKFEQVS